MKAPSTAYFGNGKLLLSGEYAVLDGAKALALPTKHGQYLFEEKMKRPQLHWTSYDHEYKRWFSARFHLQGLALIEASDLDKAMQLRKIILAAANQKTLNFSFGPKITTKTTFPIDWGLGTSSTLLACVGEWLGVDPFQLLYDTMGGSGYDIACATSKGPILYSKPDERSQVVEHVNFNPSFQDQLYFVYSGNKQNSREGIAHYRALTNDKDKLISELSAITEELLTVNNLTDFNKLIDLHENALSYYLEIPKVKNERFSDYNGSIKSLGAWGGDFVLATSTQDKASTKAYFAEKGCSTVLSYQEMIF